MDGGIKSHRQNMLFLASPEVLRGENGATITIQRSLRLSSEAQTLDEALDIYLERGPLRADRAWAAVDERESVTFSSRDALQIRLEGAERAGTEQMRSEIFVTRADNSLIYIFTIFCPARAMGFTCSDANSHCSKCDDFRIN